MILRRFSSIASNVSFHQSPTPQQTLSLLQLSSLNELHKLYEQSKKIVVLTGAGISTESGKRMSLCTNDQAAS